MKMKTHLLIALALILALPALAADYRQWATADQWQIYGELVTVTEHEGQHWVIIRRPNGQTVQHAYSNLSERSKKMAAEIIQERRKQERKQQKIDQQKSDHALNVEIQALQMEIHVLEEQLQAESLREDYSNVQNVNTLISLKQQQLQRLYEQRAAIYNARQR